MKKKNGARQRSDMESNGDLLFEQLPYDVTTYIISQLTLRERVKCLEVCKRWRATFLENPYMWRTITECKVVPDLLEYDINGKDIRHLIMQPHGRRKAYSHLVRLGCSNLKTIAYVHYSTSLQKLLDITGPALTHLEIAIGQVDMGDLFYKLFTTCPNLTHFRCIHLDIKHSRNQTQNATKLATESHATESMKRVVNLDLKPPNMDTPLLKRILSFFTGVRHISLQEPFEKDGMLDWINTTFPLLQTIRLGKVAFPCQPAKCGRYALSYTQDCVKQESIETMLKKHAPILSDFYVQTDLGMKPVYDMIQCYVIQGAPHLRSLSIRNLRCLSELPPLTDIEQLLYQFPCLDDLELENVDLRAKCQLTLQAPRPRLKKVRLVNCNGVTATKLATLISYFCYCMDWVCLVGVDGLHEQALDAFGGKVAVLRHLTLSSKDMDDTSVRKCVDSWSKRQLDFLLIFGFGIISAPSLETYTHQKLPNTKITFGSPYSDKWLCRRRPYPTFL